jgi:hypothetical protein
VVEIDDTTSGIKGSRDVLEKAVLGRPERVVRGSQMGTEMARRKR